MLRFFDSSLSDLDPAVAGLIEYEAERQARKLILIPSESQAPSAVRQALGSVFQNIYAEGYPDPSIHGAMEEAILDYETQLGHYRRYSDKRYYKGLEGDGFIFASPHDRKNQISRSGIHRAFLRIRRAAKLEATPGKSDFVIHSLRHTWCATAVSSGQSLFAVAKHMGHATTRMVERTYGHLRDDVARDTAVNVADAIVESVS